MGAAELISSYRLEVSSPPCEPGAERYNAFAHLDVDISALMPYVNAVWLGATYDKAGPHLQGRFRGHAVTLHPRMIALGGFADRAEAEALMQELIAELNRIWQERESIQPDYRKRERPSAVALYRLLPGANCKECGEETCFIFASKLSIGAAELGRCGQLRQPEHAWRLEKLRALLGEVP